MRWLFYIVSRDMTYFILLDSVSRHMRWNDRNNVGSINQHICNMFNKFVHDFGLIELPLSRILGHIY
jgi:hypothetical protein